MANTVSSIFQMYREITVISVQMLSTSIPHPVIELGLCSSLKLSSTEFRWESPLPSIEEGLKKMVHHLLNYFIINSLLYID